MDFLSLMKDELKRRLAKEPADFHQRHIAWLRAQQKARGGFGNRRGAEDLYYTAFGVRALAMLGALNDDTNARARGYLTALSANPDAYLNNAVNAVSWWDSWANVSTEPPASGTVAATTQRLDLLRREDGGWAKTPLEHNGSLYHSFLAVLALARMREPLKDTDALRRFMSSMEQSNGGFLENEYSKRPGSNGTAAGVALRILLNRWGMLGAAWSLLIQPGPDIVRHAEYVLSMRGDDGGFRATPGSPMDDLLSTFTALLTLKMGGKLTPEIQERARAYAQSMEQPDGGYVGFALEATPDCEYTFYGLGVMALTVEA